MYVQIGKWELRKLGTKKFRDSVKSVALVWWKVSSIYNII